LAKPSLFISYGRGETTTPFAQWLRRKLELAGFHVWLDATSIQGGSDWQKAIADGILGCDIVIALLDAKFTRSTFCRDEVTLAKAEQKKIFPVLLRKFGFDQLPVELRLMLATTNVMRFQGAETDHVQFGQLIRDLHACHNPGAKKPKIGNDALRNGTPLQAARELSASKAKEVARQSPVMMGRKNAGQNTKSQSHTASLSEPGSARRVILPSIKTDVLGGGRMRKDPILAAVVPKVHLTYLPGGGAENSGQIALQHEMQQMREQIDSKHNSIEQTVWTMFHMLQEMRESMHLQNRNGEEGSYTQAQPKSEVPTPKMIVRGREVDVDAEKALSPSVSSRSLSQEPVSDL